MFEGEIRRPTLYTGRRPTSGYDRDRPGPAHSDGAPTIEGSGVRVVDIAKAYEHSGFDPDGIVESCPFLTLADVYTALAFYYGHVEEFRSASDSVTA